MPWRRTIGWTFAVLGVLVHRPLAIVPRAVRSRPVIFRQNPLPSELAERLNSKPSF